MIGSSPVVGSSKNMISGACGDGPGEADALLHAAGELGRHQLGHLRRQPDHGQRLLGLGLRLRSVDPLGAEQAEGHVLPDRQAVEQRPALEQHAELAAQLVHGGAVGADRPRSPSIRIEPLSGVIRPSTHLISTDLPVPEPPITTSDWPAGEVEVDALQHLLGAEALGQAADGDLGQRLAHRLKNSSVTM